MRAGFIGAGKVGFSLGKYLSVHGIELSGYYSRNPASAQEAAAFTQSRFYENLEDITTDSDTLFLTVPDGVIGEIWDDMRNLPLKDKNICHCSGSIPSAVFFDAESKGAYRYSVHPLYAVSSKYTSWQDIGNAFFSVEGSAGHLDLIRGMLEQAGNTVVTIDPDRKTLYHAAAVMVSNQMAALADMGAALLARCGFSGDEVVCALAPLIEGNARAVAELGAVKALTGPVERGDVRTVARHLSALRSEAEGDEEMRNILNAYRMLSGQLIRIAAQKHPDRDYTQLEKELEK